MSAANSASDNHHGMALLSHHAAMLAMQSHPTHILATCLQTLREKAENRNPDEYYPAMQRGSQRTANPEAGCVQSASVLTSLLHAARGQRDWTDLR